MARGKINIIVVILWQRYFYEWRRQQRFFVMAVRPSFTWIKIFRVLVNILIHPFYLLHMVLLAFTIAEAAAAGRSEASAVRLGKIAKHAKGKRKQFRPPNTSSASSDVKCQLFQRFFYFVSFFCAKHLSNTISCLRTQYHIRPAGGLVNTFSFLPVLVTIVLSLAEINAVN